MNDPQGCVDHVGARLTAQAVLAVAAQEEWVTVAEYARYFRLSCREVRHLLDKGAVPCVRQGRHVRIPSRVILAAQAAHESA